MVDAALWYRKQGFSVIPAKKDKKPFVKWTPYQNSSADEIQIREWWDKWPNANIALVTGKVSDVTVLDADSEAGKESVEEFLSDSMLVPTVKTPNGWHFYFKHTPGLSNGVRVLHDCDIRTDGGYVIAPPSKNGESIGYEWLEGLHVKNNQPVAMPEMVAEIIKQQCFSSNSQTDTPDSTRSSSLLYSSQNDSNIEQHDSNICNIFTKGRRDNDLFRVANCLIKGGMSEKHVTMYLIFIAKCCVPPFSEKDAMTKIQSALSRQKDRQKVTTREIREWIGATSGNFSATNLYIEQQLQHKKAKAQARAVLSRLCNEGLIERVGRKDGIYRRVENDAPRIDVLNAKTEYIDIKFPLSLHEYYRPMAKNIVVIAGTQDVGKTAFMLNIAKLNMNRRIEIRYCTSEMGASELRSRVELFEPEVPLSDWMNVDFRDRATNFQDMILPNGLNIIDYLEISDAFYTIGGLLTDIYNRLEKGIAIIAIQKDSKADYGRGGTFSLEKPRLYLTLTANPPEGNIAKIAKCKNWARQDTNPNNRECVFKVIKGSQIRQVVQWGLPSKLNKEV